MCVILDIPANRNIPDDMLAQACDINPDGYGIAWIEKGSIHIKRSIEKNNHSEIQELLNKLTRHRRLVHLRFSTVGEVSLANNHPFVVLENRKGPQVVLFHNGTLYDYKYQNTKLSDTFYFTQDFVAPLAQRTAAYAGDRKLFDDGFFQKRLKKEIGLSSVVVLFHSNGRVLRFNEDKGQQYETFWASNSYSFDRNHIRSSSYTPYRSVRDIANEHRVARHTATVYPSPDLPWEITTPERQTQVDAWAEAPVPTQTSTNTVSIVSGVRMKVPNVQEKALEFNRFRDHVFRLKRERSDKKERTTL